MNTTELITNYGNIVPTYEPSTVQFKMKELVANKNLEKHAAVPSDEFDEYINRTSDQPQTGLGIGSPIDTTLKQFVIDQADYKNAQEELLNGQSRVDAYNTEAAKFKALQEGYGNMNVSADGTVKVDYTGIDSNDATFLKQLHQVEAGGKNPTTPNKSGYIGMYQQRYRPGDIGSIWAKKHGYTPQQILANPKLQNQMMVDQIGGYKKSFAKSGIPVNNYTLFLAHNQGLGGTRAIMSGKLTPNIRRNIRNQGISGKSDYELIQNYHRKFKPRFSGSPKVAKVATKPSIKPFTPGYITDAKKNVVRLTGSGYDSNGVATNIPEASKEVQSWFGPNGNFIL